MIHHRGLVNYLTWAVTAYDVASGSGALVHSSLSFDLTITGLFAPLLVGRGVTIVAAQHDISALSRTLRQRKNASLVKITPAHLELLRRQLSAEEMAGRTRAFVIGGETLLGESVAFWQEHSPDTVVVNEYGPTETVVGCCVYFVPRERRFAGAVPIGRPIANTQLYVLDADLQPVPAGEKGELYIAGDGVARGYLNLPDVSARSFVANPFYAPGAVTSPRMY
jgi:non-ribosomal peptide synthetase component F